MMNIFIQLPLCLPFLLSIYVKANDPCSNYKTLYQTSFRMVNNRYDSGFGNAISDHNLVEGWYRAGDVDMPTTAPRIFRCGTRYPIWMNGTVPNNGEEVDRDACVVAPFSECDYRFSIKVRNCGHFRVYYLFPTLGSDEAYCFGIGDEVGRPLYKPNTPLLTTNLETKLITEEVHGQKLKTICNFSTENSENGTDLMYEVTWYFNDHVQFSTDTVDANNVYKIQTIILDDNGFKMGSNISCSVLVKFSKNGPPGHSAKSENSFLGIKVLTEVVILERGSAARIRLKRTAPIGCVGKSKETCGLRLLLPKEDKCTRITVTGAKTCGINMKNNDDINKDLTIDIGAIYEQKHLFSKLFFIRLQTPPRNTNHPIWESYELPVIKVYVVDPKSIQHSRTFCQAIDDPHMLTFDHRPYDIQFGGQFIMYKHKSDPLEVQTRFTSCIRNGKTPFCTCGVAVRAGRDVFVVDRCGDDHAGNFYSCFDDVLDVEKKNSKLFMAHMPTGTRVNIQLTHKFLTVQIYPSIRDVENVEGLCGNLNYDCTDEFKLRGGGMDTTPGYEKECDNRKWDYTFRPNKFSESWSLNFASSLFDNAVDFQNLDPWPETRYFCACPEFNSTVTGGDPKPIISCSANEVSTCNVKDVLPHTGICKIRLGHKTERSTLPLKRSRERRDVWRQSHTKIDLNSQEVPTTMEAARELCQKHANESIAFRLCADIPNVYSGNAIETCAMDIIISNTTDWLDDSREALKERCMVELNMNTTLQESSDGEASIAQTIQNVTCPGECGGAGVCKNGKCICNEGFGAPDCSINLSIPPYFSKFSDSAICDKKQWECTFASIDGEGFVDEGSPSCKIQTVYMKNNGTIFEDGDKIISAQVQTYLNTFCPLPSQRRKRSTSDLELSDTFVKSYKISLSNDGVNFGIAEEFYVIDSDCQEPLTVDGQLTFILKDDFCFINGKCIHNNELNAFDSCSVCNSNSDKFKWTKRTGLSECGSVEPKQTSYAWIAGVVVGAVAAAVVIVIVIWKLHTRKSGRIKRSQVFAHPPSYAEQKHIKCV